jgi:transcriptional regulator with XRE-family HTH domain
MDNALDASFFAGQDGAMKLHDWLTETETSTTRLAELVGVSQSTVWRWVQGKMVPDMERMRRVAEATDGRVMPNDFMTSPPGG